VALVLYAYSTNERSSRGIERRCRQDVAFRVITGNQTPDHATVARFIRRHQQALNELFGAVLRLCARAGLVDSGIVAVDGTKLTANASSDSNVDYDRIAREIIEDALATDEAEDEKFGDARGDELPEELRTATGRRAWLERELAGDQASDPTDCRTEAEGEFDPDRIGRKGRRGSREERLRFAARCLEDDLASEHRGNRAYEGLKEHLRATNKRKVGGPTKPYTPPVIPAGEVNVTDPDSRRMKGNRRYIQGYNAQAVVTEQQIVIAAEITTSPNDFQQLAPMIDTALRELDQAGAQQWPSVVVADAQYWNEQGMDHLTADHGLQVLIPPDGGKRQGERPGWTGGRFSFMRTVLGTELGKELYRKRQTAIEPVFGHTKHNRQIYRLHYRGRSLVRTEWRLVMLSHNLQKLHRHLLADALG
jgi:hypothetical protein